MRYQYLDIVTCTCVSSALWINIEVIVVRFKQTNPAHEALDQGSDTYLDMDCSS